MPRRSRTFSTAEVSAAAGVHRDTLLRWLREGRIVEPRRDRNGWRAFTQRDLERVTAFAGPDISAPPHEAHPPPHPSEIQHLESLDWDFHGAKTSYLTHGIHPYPAKFIPQIPNALIQELSSVGETVADIFCGSGTTLVEALTLKRHAVGIDANPLATLISRAKTTHVSSEDASALQELAARALSLGVTLDGDPANALFSTPFTSNAPRPDLDAIRFWFEPFVIEELAEIRDWCRSLASSNAQVVALAAFSSIIVTLSRQDSDTRYVRREKRLRTGDAFRRFGRALEEATRAAMEFTELCEPRFKCTVIEADVLAGPDIGKVDLVVCSPPYPNAYSYHLYHMTRMLWLEMDQPLFKRREIGSHRKFSSKSAHREGIAPFRKDMDVIFGWLRTAVHRNRYACFVVGNSIIGGQVFNNADLITTVGNEHGFAEICRIRRRMQDTKKAFNPKIGKIKEEQIVVLQNSEGIE